MCLSGSGWGDILINPSIPTQVGDSLDLRCLFGHELWCSKASYSPGDCYFLVNYMAFLFLQL